MKTLKQKKLDELAKEMPSINEKGQQAVNGNYKVVITTTRSGLGSSSTLSYWGAMAYDEKISYRSRPEKAPEAMPDLSRQIRCGFLSQPEHRQETSLPGQITKSDP